MVLSIPEFRKDFGREYAGNYVLDADWQSAFSGGPIASSIVGTFGAGYIADKIGRKPLMIGSIAVSFAAIALEFVATTNAMFFGGKFINGFVTGIILSVAVTYIGEVTPLALRGIFTCLTALMMTIGPLTSAIIVNYTGNSPTRWAYRAVFCAQFGFAGVSAIFAPFVPESPVWLISVDKDDRATKALQRLGYTNPVDLAMRVSQIRTTLQEAKAEVAGATYLDCFRKSNLRRTIISVMPLAIQALSGVFFIASYGTYYMQLAGYSTSDSFKLQIAQHGCSMAGNICSWYLIDKVGRRPLTFWGTFSITVILMICAGLATEGSPGAIKGSVAFIVIYNFFYNISIGATAYTLLCEVATSKLRVKTISIGVALQYLIYLFWAFVIPYLFNPDKANLGAKTAFIFGGIGLLCLVYLWFYQPETAGRSFKELDELFMKGVSVREFGTYKTRAELEGEQAQEMGKSDTA
ncbi:putative mfs hexose transporter protein [Phaeoacremonium minimum UCRPA7]|uniref:Putative mfs hexose transporter protein n=1 Tax=Phaeoacremonium minimum (strain UCR-PA7) TaxID=1286976 RepID=R8B959_PHAM7|nr:putative mfs hexose transporter protein [Phaeoacremonium minimum UCRPA7]EON95830.1 putative mfs hexose transporter protein [Phaeoacremonium minimum UCRPA7]